MSAVVVRGFFVCVYFLKVELVVWLSIAVTRNPCCTIYIHCRWDVYGFWRSKLSYKTNEGIGINDLPGKEDSRSKATTNVAVVPSILAFTVTMKGNSFSVVSLVWMKMVYTAIIIISSFIAFYYSNYLFECSTYVLRNISHELKNGTTTIM